MFEHISVVGERGQITIPKIIREIGGIKERDKVIVKIENEKIIVEKVLSIGEKEKLMREYYTKYGAVHKKITKEWDVVDKEADKILDEY